MSRLALAALVLVAACDQGSRQPRFERLDPPVQTPVAPAQPPPPPPPPGGPPSPPPHVAAPPAITDFVRAHENDPGEWRVYFVEDRDGTKRKAMLSRPASKELVEGLVKEDAFVDGDYGCLTDPLVIDITRGPASLTLTENCGHLRVGSSTDDAMLGTQLVQLIRDQRALVLP